MKNKLNQFIYSRLGVDSTTNVKNDYFWYSLGSISFAFSTLLMTILVSRVLGGVAGGIISIGLSIASWLATISYFEIRTYQITDVKKEFSFNDYLTTRSILCVLSFVVCFAYVMMQNYSQEKLIIILLICLFRIVETIGDIFEGEFQVEKRVDLVGKSIFFRTVSSLVVFTVFLLITKNLIVALIAMNVVCILMTFVLNFIPMKFFCTFKLEINLHAIRSLLFACAPLALSAFLSTYIVNASKLSVDHLLGDEAQLFYSAIFMPNMVINLFSGMIFKPMQTQLAIYYAHNDLKYFFSQIFKMMFIIFGFTFVCIVGGYILGIPILSLLYGVDLSNNKIQLIVLLLGGGVNALNVIFFYVLTIMRRQKIMTLLYVICTVSALLISDSLTAAYGLLGAAFSYLLIVSILSLLLIITIICYLKKEKKI